MAITMIRVLSGLFRGAIEHTRTKWIRSGRESQDEIVDIYIYIHIYVYNIQTFICISTSQLKLIGRLGEKVGNFIQREVSTNILQGPS